MVVHSLFDCPQALFSLDLHCPRGVSLKRVFLLYIKELHV